MPCIMLAVLALEFVLLTTADGRTVAVNPSAIAAVRPPRKNEAFIEGTRCLIFTIDGKFISARDECEVIVEKAGGDKNEYKLQSEKSRPYKLPKRQ